MNNSNNNKNNNIFSIPYLNAALISHLSITEASLIHTAATTKIQNSKNKEIYQFNLSIFKEEYVGMTVSLQNVFEDETRLNE
jgi:hypothetical protein